MHSLLSVLVGWGPAVVWTRSEESGTLVQVVQFGFWRGMSRRSQLWIGRLLGSFLFFFTSPIPFR